MKNLKIYIVTYKRPEVLNNTLDCLFNKTDFSKLNNSEVNVINNHSDFYLKEEFKEKVNVIHNNVRPDWDVGNLSRNWNQALLLGFKDLNNPDSKIVTTMQNDITLDPNWVSNLLQMHKNHTFITGKLGDNIISYRPEAVRRIGLWDERFCSIAHKEADYYIRALIFNKEKSIINDLFHRRFLNVDKALALDQTIYQGNEQDWLKTKASLEARESTRHSSQIFYWKWKDTWKADPSYKGWLTEWSNDFIDNPPSPPKVESFINYHYFEKDVETLVEQNYVGFRKGDLWMRSTGNLEIESGEEP